MPHSTPFRLMWFVQIVDPKNIYLINKNQYFENYTRILMSIHSKSVTKFLCRTYMKQFMYVRQENTNIVFCWYADLSFIYIRHFLRCNLIINHMVKFSRSVDLKTALKMLSILLIITFINVALELSFFLTNIEQRISNKCIFHSDFWNKNRPV